ncbi:MAG: hypothetical protein H0U16_07885 [Actinobacteria bacterium]|nr:hypothetical protein [Actinomycetota bacterium]
MTDALTTLRGIRRALELPKAARWPKLKGVVATYERLRHEQRAEQARYHELNRRLDVGRAEDRDAFARALKAGKDDPGTSAAEAVADEIEQSKRKLEAFDVAIRQAEADVVQAVEANRTKWAGDAGEGVDAARGEFLVAVAKLEVASEKLAEAQALETWVKGFPHSAKSVRVVQSPVEGLRKPSGESYLVPEVVAALRAAMGPPAAKDEQGLRVLYENEVVPYRDGPGMR